MLIRTMKPEDLQECFKLMEFAFQVEWTPEMRKERMARMNPGEMLGAFVEGELAAVLRIIPLNIHLGEHTFPMGGIASVATWPEYRRQGLVAQLLTHALQQMKERGQIWSFLHPFKFSFYRKFGWELFTEFKQYEILTDQLPAASPTNGRVVKEENLDVYKQVYAAYASRFNGPLVRDQAWWEWNVMTLKNANGMHFVYYDENGAAKGYILYSVKQRIMTIQELVYLDDEARRGLWTFIRNHDSMIDKAVWKAPVSDPLPLLVDNPRIKQEIVPYFMARVVDAESVLRDYPFAATGETTEVQLKLRDEYAPWNNGLYTVRIAGDGRALVNRASEQPGEVGDDLVCDIQTLSALLLNYVRPGLLHETGRLQGPAEMVERLEKRIPARTAYLPDFF